MERLKQVLEIIPVSRSTWLDWVAHSRQSNWGGVLAGGIQK